MSLQSSDLLFSVALNFGLPAKLDKSFLPWQPWAVAFGHAAHIQHLDTPWMSILLPVQHQQLPAGNWEQLTAQEHVAFTLIAI